MNKRAITAICILILVTISLSFKPPSKSKLIIHFTNYVGNQKLKLDSASYRNELGQPYTVSLFKYYISNLHLKNKNGGDYSYPNGYFLVNEDDDSSQQLVLNNVPQGDYVSVSFMLGVDSLHNCSGAQSGALDPVNGMFWAWNTGYIFLKFEGRSPASHSPGNYLEFHIGGYKQPANCIRTITLSLESPVHLTNDKPSSLTIKADVSEIFKTPVTIDFSKLSSVTDFHNAQTIANNYSDMFSVIP